jgi:hypothetical protein
MSLFSRVVGVCMNVGQALSPRAWRCTVYIGLYKSVLKVEGSR